MFPGKSLSELLNVIPYRASSPELRIECGKDRGPGLVKKVEEWFLSVQDANIMTLDGVRVDTKDGWGLIRSSNTEPVICLRFESGSSEGLRRLRNTFVQVLAPHFDLGFIEKKVTWPGI